METDNSQENATMMDTPINSFEMHWSCEQTDPYDALQDQVPLSSLCPQCFGDNPQAVLGFYSFDGNFQHKRFPTSKTGDNTYLELRDKRLFIDEGDSPIEVYYNVSWLF